MIDVNQEYTREVECEYKGEKYKVRDNGAIFRMAREGKPKRPKDEIWTFGETIVKGYACFCSEPVHRIVATAFLGAPPTNQHIVDHFDTNRQNNRPENLRWLTKLENILLNPITRKKIEYLCGSVENFLKDTSQVKGYENDDKNFSWMRAVSQEEAQNTLASWERLQSRPKPEIISKGNPIEEWIFQQHHNEKKDNFLFDAKPVEKPVFRTMPAEDAEDKQEDQPISKPIEPAISKKEFMMAIVEICEGEGWKYEKYYKTDEWKADILISVNNQRFSFSAYKSTNQAAKFLPLIEQDGIKSYGLILSSEDDVAEIACFSLHRNEDAMEITIAENKLTFASFMKKVIEGKLIHLTKTKITSIDVIFAQEKCYRCQFKHFIPYVRFFINENGKRYNRADVDERELPDLWFGEEYLQIIKRYIDEHPEKGIVMGEVKERPTKNQSYTSYGCPACDAIFGDFYLTELEVDFMYETDESMMNRIQLKTPFEIPVNEWVVKD